MNEVLKQSLEAVLEKLSEELPQLKEIMDSAKAGELSEQEAMSALMKEVQQNPQHMPTLMAVMQDAFAPTRDTSDLVPTPKADLKEAGDTAFWNGVGLPQMNPLAQAAIAERIQFDGDVPELRTGPAPEGVAPAVSVHTSARSSVVMGQMLKDASDKVSQSLQDANLKRAEILEKIANADKEATTLIASQMGFLAEMGEDTDLVAVAHSERFDPEGYKRGQVPAPVAVPTPSGSTLATLTESQRQESVWRFLSTTQGRRSAMESLRTLIGEGLEKKGLSVEKREYDPTKTKVPLAFHEWKVNLSGKASMQPTFSIIDTAAGAIASALAERVRKEDPLPESLYLEVVPVDTVDIRKVGWAARIVTE